MKKISLPKVHEVRGNGMRLLAVRTKTKDVVYMHGSVRGGKNMVPPKEQGVVLVFEELLDAGTKKKTKDELRSEIAKLGATLAFTTTGERTHFSASCLPEDVEKVLGITVECLVNAVFPPEELELAKKRILAELEESKTITRRVALRALNQDLYGESHPNEPLPISEVMTSVRAVTRRHVLAFHKKLGRDGLQLVIGGDINPGKILKSAQESFKLLPQEGAPPSKLPIVKQKKAKKTLISISDKANIDVVIGGRAGILRSDERFLAYTVLLSMLGGGGVSTGHLMRTVRERDGLTYGIRSFPSGFEEGFDGNMTIWATFAPSVFEKGVETIHKEVSTFLTKGITPKLLLAKKEEMVGKYVVGLSTTLGLVSALTNLLEEGRDVSYLHEYPVMVNKLTLQEVKEARDLIPLSNLSLAAAGTFEK